MQSITIQKHQPGTTYQQPHFFIQSKGFHAGRPSLKSYSISLVVLTSDDFEAHILYWVCYGLWKTNRFSQAFKKTSRPELDIAVAKKIIAQACHNASLHVTTFITSVNHLRQLTQTEKLLSAQIKMIKHVKKALARKMMR